MRVLFDDAEIDAMRGLPLLARCVYMLGLRPYMDYQTGIVGQRRGISRRSIAEDLYVEQAQGRHRDEQGMPTEKAIRNALDTLIDAGLLERIPADRRLVFRCLKAATDQSVQNMRGRRGADVGPTMSDREEPSNGAGSDDMRGRRGADPEPAMRGLHPVSGNGDISTTIPTGARARSNGEANTPATATAWAQFMIQQRRFPRHLVQTEKTIPMFAQWVRDGVTADEALAGMAAAEAKLGRMPDSPMYYRNFVEGVRREAARMAEEAERHEAHTAAPRNGSPYKLSAVDRLAAARERFEARERREREPGVRDINGERID